MGQHYDAIVSGGGHNGLVNAAYLAKAGKQVVVLERRHPLGVGLDRSRVGGVRSPGDDGEGLAGVRCELRRHLVADLT